MRNSEGSHRVASGTISGLNAKVRELVWPTVPGEIRDAFVQAQLRRVLSHMPMIYAIASVNLGLIIAVCSREGKPLWSYAWMGLLLVFSLVRMVQWMGRAKRPELIAAPDHLLVRMTVVAITMMTGLSLWSSWSFVTGLFSHVVLIPVSLCFGVTCVAHCLAPLRTAATGALICGIVPVGLTMAAGGAFENQMLGLSMLSIAALMVRFVSEQHDQLVKSLVLEHRITEQANTDPLTGLANRRAVMARLEADVASGKPFALALLDLDGFKQVNDTFGHQVGDALLVVVADRLKAASPESNLVGRLGGDEFIVLMRGASTRETAGQRTSALLAELARPVTINGHAITFGASLGFAVVGIDGTTAEKLLTVADEALYAVKRERKAAAGRVSIAA